MGKGGDLFIYSIVAVLGYRESSHMVNEDSVLPMTTFHLRPRKKMDR